MYLSVLIITLGVDISFGQFSSHTSDYDAYGLKITGNDIMLVEALGDTEIFRIRFAPYNSTAQSLQCPIPYNNSNQYVYSVGIGEKQNSNQSYFFYADEIISNKSSGQRDTFISILTNKDPQKAQAYEDTNTLFNII